MHCYCSFVQFLRYILLDLENTLFKSGDEVLGICRLGYHLGSCDKVMYNYCYNVNVHVTCLVVLYKYNITALSAEGAASIEETDIIYTLPTHP